MATYKIKGKRYLKKYTAPRSTPVYAAAVEAQAIVDRLCDVAWEESPEPSAGMAYHTSDEIEETGKSGFDSNVIQREHLDAAAWCAGHSGGQHRAYANAACYVFELPDAQSYPSLTSLKAKVTSDPYNSSGVRLAVHTNSTGEIPINCATARTGAAHVEGFAKRTVETVNGTDYWYPTTADCTITPDGGLQLQKYLLVVVALEDYSTVRGNWIEGSAYINPEIEITTSPEVIGWTNGTEVNAVASTIFMVSFQQRGSETTYKVTATNQSEAAGDFRLHPHVAGDIFIPGAVFEVDGALTRDFAAGYNAGGTLKNFMQNWRGVEMAYSGFYEDKFQRINPAFQLGLGALGSVVAAATPAAAFFVGDNHLPEGDLRFFIARKKLLIPFIVTGVKQCDFKTVQLNWQAKYTYQKMAGDASPTLQFNVWMKLGQNDENYGDETLQKHELWTAEVADVGAWRLVGSFTRSYEEYNGGKISNTAESQDEYGNWSINNLTNESQTLRLPFSVPLNTPHTFLLTVYTPNVFVRSAYGLDSDSKRIIACRGDNAIFFNGTDKYGALSYGWSPQIQLKT